ncbi:MAG: calcium-binding protein [Planctomycetota bacterium]
MSRRNRKRKPPAEAKFQAGDHVRVRHGVCDVDDETLLTYYRYLAKNMPFPFEVEHFEETGPFEGKSHLVTVVGLLDPDAYECDEMYGLVCEARTGKREIQMPLGEFEVDEDDPGLQRLADYCYWFWNHR